MQKIIKTIASGLLAMSTFTAMAAPANFVTHNFTNTESNARINGRFSPYPTNAQSTNSVSWFLVGMACIGQNPCKADIFVETNTSHPYLIGTFTMNLQTGDITPKSLVNGKYKVTVNGPGESTLTYK